MNPRQRVLAALQHQPVDQIPRCEVWIDALYNELGVHPEDAHPALGQDILHLPWQAPPTSNAWRTGVDEWGRIWKAGTYAGGVVDTWADLARFTPSPDYAKQFFDVVVIEHLKDQYPDHCYLFGTHIGPFMMSYMALGFERFFYCLYDDPAFIQALLTARTEWCLAVFRRAIELGAQVLVMGDDAAHRSGPMISPRLWYDLVLPHHHRIVEELPVPVIWHTDGNVEKLLPFAIEAGFVGVHGLEPAAGMNLSDLRQQYTGQLALIGNFDVRCLFSDNLEAVRAEIDRCLSAGGDQGGYLFSTCNSIFPGMHPAAVAELFRYSAACLNY